MDDSDNEEFQPAKKNRRGQKKTPPNQQKIDAMLSKKVPAAKKIPKNVPTKKELPKVDPLDFFSSTKMTPKKKVTPKKATPVKVKSPEVVEMIDSDEEPAIKKSRGTPKKSTTPKQDVSVKKLRTPKKVTPKKEPTPKKETPPKISKKQTVEEKPAAKKMSKKNPVVVAPPPRPKIRHPTPPKALPALPPPKRAELPWVDKYKPASLKDLVGQGTPASPTNKLLKWLQEWFKNNRGVGALIKKKKPGMFEAQKDGTAFKAVLLSGPPGNVLIIVSLINNLSFRYWQDY